MGTTVDARKGVVELTSLSAPGAAPQKARFSEGMFRVTQAGAITELTLNEPLDCGKQGARGAEEEAEVAQAVGRRQGQVPHQGHLQRRHRPRHEVARPGHLHDHARPGSRRASSPSATPSRRKTITLRAGKRYTARAKRR